MLKLEYLYGPSAVINRHSWRTCLYPDILNTKIQLAGDLIEKLLEVGPMKRDSIRINACLAAQKFNKELLKEMT